MDREFVVSVEVDGEREVVANATVEVSVAGRRFSWVDVDVGSMGTAGQIGPPFRWSDLAEPVVVRVNSSVRGVVRAAVFHPDVNCGGFGCNFARMDMGNVTTMSLTVPITDIQKGCERKMQEFTAPGWMKLLLICALVTAVIAGIICAGSARYFDDRPPPQSPGKVGVGVALTLLLPLLSLTWLMGPRRIAKKTTIGILAPYPIPALVAAGYSFAWSRHPAWSCRDGKEVRSFYIFQGMCGLTFALFFLLCTLVAKFKLREDPPPAGSRRGGRG
jgi:hypothetical protein